MGSNPTVSKGLFLAVYTAGLEAHSPKNRVVRLCEGREGSLLVRYTRHSKRRQRRSPVRIERMQSRPSTSRTMLMSVKVISGLVSQSNFSAVREMSAHCRMNLEQVHNLLLDALQQDVPTWTGSGL